MNTPEWWRSRQNAKVELLIAAARTAHSRQPGFAMANYFFSHRSNDAYLEIYSTNSIGVKYAISQLKQTNEEYVIQSLVHNLEPFELNQVVTEFDLEILHKQRKPDCDLLRAKKRLDWMLLHKQARIVPDANGRTKVDLLKLLNDEAQEAVPSIERVDPQVLATCMILEYNKRSFAGFSKIPLNINQRRWQNIR